MPYQINYEADPADAAETGREVQVALAQPPQKRRREIPSVVMTFLLGGATLSLIIGLEMAGPKAVRPSEMAGTFYARVITHESAAELGQKAKLDIWAKEAELANAQNVENYKTSAQIILQYQAAVRERALAYAQTTAKLQNDYVGQRMELARRTQGGDQTMQTYAQLFGNFFNVIEPGSGDAALQYSDEMKRKMSSDLDDAVLNGVTIDVKGWDTGLPSPEEFQRQLDTLKPVPIPSPPVFGEDRER